MSAMTSPKRIAAKAALDFYIEHGVDESVSEEPINKTLLLSNFCFTKPPFIGEGK